MNDVHNEVAGRFVEAVLCEHPEWRTYLSSLDSSGDSEGSPSGVQFVVPSPAHHGHYLEILQDGNTIEVAYDAGVKGLRAEQQFVFKEDQLALALPDLFAFLERLLTGEILVACENLGKVTRWLRGDGVSALAWFRTLDDIAESSPGEYFPIYSWVDPVPED